MYRISIGKRYDSGTDYVYKSFIHQKLVAHTHRKTHTKKLVDRLQTWYQWRSYTRARQVK